MSRVLARGVAQMRWARYSASSLTQPSSAEPRVCCHGRPRKYRPGDGGDAALVHEAAVGVEDRRVDPRVVEPEAGGPDDGASARSRRRRRSVTSEPATSTVRAVEVDAVAAGARAGSTRSASRGACMRRPIRESRGLAHQAGGFEVAEQVAAERCAAAAGSAATPIERCTSWVRGELLGDLKAGVAAADDEHRPAGHVARGRGRRCCGTGRRRGPGARRRRARAGPGTGRWRRRPGRLRRCGRRARRGSRARRGARRGPRLSSSTGSSKSRA